VTRKEWLADYYQGHKHIIAARWRERKANMSPAKLDAMRKYQREWRRNNISKYNAYYSGRISILRSAKDIPCMDCNTSYPHYVMQFDHRDAANKRFNLGGSWSMYGTKSILTEIAKCDVVCANCHAARTWKRGHGGL